MSLKVHGLFLKMIGDGGMSRLFSCFFRNLHGISLNGKAAI